MTKQGMTTLRKLYDNYTSAMTKGMTITSIVMSQMRRYDNLREGMTIRMTISGKV